jgi:uncharacterized protein (DUF302 family)
MRLGFALALLLAAPAAADEASVTAYPFDGSFEDAAFAVEAAIVGQGLVLDHVNHVGAMLARTGADVGSAVHLFDAAQVFTFCSAVVSRQVMEADPENLAFCPYGIYVAEREGRVTVGYRRYPPGALQAVEALLDTIARAAVGD